MKYTITRLCCILFSIYSLSTFAQQHEIKDSNIRSLQVIANGKWQELPVMMINEGRISIDFDDLTHTYRRLTYTGVPLQGCLTVISLKDLHREIQSRTSKSHH